MHMNSLTQNLSRRRDISYHFLHAVDRARPLESVNSYIFTLLGGFIQSEDHLYADDSRCISLFQTSLSPKLQVWIPDCSCVSILKQLINSSNITCLKTELLIFVTCPFLPPQSVPPPSFLSQLMTPPSVLHQPIWPRYPQTSCVLSLITCHQSPHQHHSTGLGQLSKEQSPYFFLFPVLSPIMHSPHFEDFRNIDYFSLPPPY